METVHCSGQEFSHMKSKVTLSRLKLGKCKHNSLIDNALIYSREMRQSWVGEGCQWTVPCLYLLQIREMPRLDNLGEKSPLFMFGFLNWSSVRITKHKHIHNFFKISSRAVKMHFQLKWTSQSGGKSFWVQINRNFRSLLVPLPTNSSLMSW